MELQWLACVLGSLPLIGWLLWSWNEIWYVNPIKARCSVATATATTKNIIKVPPGHLGFPLFGELLNFLWYFKILRCPDGFINSKRQKYGRNIGAYRTYLFGSPSIIACSPSLCKFVLNSNDRFKLEWPVGVVGANSLLALDGVRHDRVKNLLINVITRPDALARIVIQVQPAIIAALFSWSQITHIKALHQVKKVTFESMGRYFASFEPGPQLDELEKLFLGIVGGFRSQPWNIPGTAYYNAIKCRKKISAVLKAELERRKQSNVAGATNNVDLLEGLMQMRDEQGGHLKDEEVLDNVISSITNGYLSVAYLVSWSLYFLAKSPHILLKLRDENREIIKKKKDMYITYEDILKLKYTSQVVEETIRMANIAVTVPRTAIDDIEYEGYIIPKGWKVVIWLRALHTDPDNFEDPMCFNPDRWNTRPRHGTYLRLEEDQELVPEVPLFEFILPYFFIICPLGTLGNY